MGKDSKIGWTDNTFNPWWGCTKVDTDCKNCYADQLSKRVGKDVWGPNKPRAATSDKNWAQVLKWNADAEKAGEMRRVFCASMSDVFEEARPVVTWDGRPRAGFTEEGELRDYTTDDLRARLWKLIEATPWLDWLLLSKRPENINGMIPEAWRESPPRNVMFGMSAGNQATFDERFPAFVEVKGRKFLSLEPLIGPLDFRSIIPGFTYVDWVIVGGESGPGARPFDVAWARGIEEACRASGIPVFVKQLGSQPFADNVISEVPRGWGKGENWDLWPEALEDLRVREFPRCEVPVQTSTTKDMFDGD